MNDYQFNGRDRYSPQKTATCSCVVHVQEKLPFIVIRFLFCSKMAATAANGKSAVKEDEDVSSIFLHIS